MAKTGVEIFLHGMKQPPNRYHRVTFLHPGGGESGLLFPIPPPNPPLFDLYAGGGCYMEFFTFVSKPSRKFNIRREQNLRLDVRTSSAEKDRTIFLNNSGFERFNKIFFLVSIILSKIERMTVRTNELTNERTNYACEI